MLKHRQMGIHAERASLFYELLNEDSTALSAFRTRRGARYLIVTRHKEDSQVMWNRSADNQKGVTTYHIPKDMWWENRQKPVHAILLSPWEEQEECIPPGWCNWGMTRWIHDKMPQDRLVVRVTGVLSLKIVYDFLSNMQYPFLDDIRRHRL